MNQKKIIILFIVIIFVVILCDIGLVTFHNRLAAPKDSNPSYEFNNETEAELDVKQNGVSYSCQKSGQDITTSDNITYHLNYIYNFNYSPKMNDIKNYVYNISYVFNSLSDYDAIQYLPSVFKNMEYEIEENRQELTKTLKYVMKMNFQEIDKKNYVNSYLEILKQEGYICIEISG